MNILHKFDSVIGFTALELARIYTHSKKLGTTSKGSQVWKTYYRGERIVILVVSEEKAKEFEDRNRKYYDYLAGIIN